MCMNHPAFEALEGRTLFSGNIAWGLSKGNLTLTGDAMDNGVTITRHGDTVTLTPGAGTSIAHGQAGAAVELTGVTGKITIRMGAGNDSLTLTGQVFDGAGEPFAIGAGGGDLAVDMGKGDDLAVLAGVQARNVSVITGSGNNSLTITGLDADQASDDPVDIQSVIQGWLKVQGGDGAETVSLQGIYVAGSVTLKLGVGANAATISPFDGSDADFDLTVGGDLVFDSSFARQANTLIFQDPGDVGKIAVAGSLRVSLGLLDDVLTVAPEAGLIVGKVFFVNGCYGNDTFNLSGVHVDGLFILNSGVGDDVLNLSNVSAGLAQWIDGQLTVTGFPSFSLPRGLSQSVQTRWISSGTCPIVPPGFAWSW